jgi:hypothetical protein
MAVIAELAPTLSRLVAVPVDRLVLHESVEPGRLRSITASLRGESVLRNPVLATPLPQGRWLVIDGAHRACALRELGLALALVQIFQPHEYGLSAWHHVTTFDGTPEDRPGRWPRDQLADWLADRFGQRLEQPDRPDRPERFGAGGGSGDGRCPVCLPDGLGRCVATVQLPGRTEHVWTASGDVASAAGLLHALAARALEGRPPRRVAADDSAALHVAAGQAVIAYRPWTIGDICALVEYGLLLPPGITRFVVPGRVLGLDVPLSLLADASSGPEAVRRHVGRRKLRYYAEPVFVAE